MKKIFCSFLPFLLFTTTHAAIRINEIAWSGTTKSANDEWIELFNDGEEAVSLENWTLNATDGSPQILLSGTIEPAGFFLLERTDDSTVPNFIASQIYTGSLSNTGEALILRDETGREHNKTPTGNWIAGESTPERRSMTWTENKWQTFSGNANTDDIFGTPGKENVIPLPKNTFVSAIPTSVKITELAPVAIGEPEWFEIEVFAETAIDFSDWKIRQGTNEIPFSVLQLSNGGTSLTGKSVNLLETGLVGIEQLNGTDHTFEENTFVWFSDNSKTPLRFLGNPSPIGLPDNGGTLEIINSEEEVLTSFLWENTKSGTKEDVSWGEIWNWGEIKYWPWRSFENNPTHTRDLKNKPSPAIPEEISLVIDEVAPNRDKGLDFIEILVKNIPEGKKLPPWKIKHNGTELFVGGGESVSENNRITLFLSSEKISDDPIRYQNKTYSKDISSQKIWESSTKNGLNKTSGTLELNIWTDTSWEKTADFVCWAKDELPETEKNRLESHENEWNGSCFKNENILPNESIARPIQSVDSNEASNFFRHFNGSPQKENLPQNNPPIPKILIQGGKKVYETSLNLTGMDEQSATTDPDGMHDILSWSWEIEGKSCGNYATDNWEWSATRKELKTCEEESASPNPALIYFNFQQQETFQAKLTVEDFSGTTESVIVELTRDPFQVGGSGGSVFNAPLKKWIEKEFEETILNTKQTKQIGNYAHGNDDFFDEFLAKFDYTLIDPRTFQPVIPQKTELELFARNRVSPKTQAYAKKNIGLIFVSQ